MPINGRQKGSRGERELAKTIEAWWQRLEPDARFKRTPGSGGWSSPDVRSAFRTSGDLVTTAKRWPWCVEVKWRENWSREWLTQGRASPVWGWWRQCQKAALECDQWPAMFFRKNRTPWLLMLSAGDPNIDGIKLGKGTRRSSPLWMREPVMSWSIWDLKCDFGDHYPIVYNAPSLFAMPPRLFAL